METLSLACLLLGIATATTSIAVAKFLEKVSASFFG
jgi:hypothetical protein